jgi:LacI family transcriptional regulator
MGKEAFKLLLEMIEEGGGAVKSHTKSRIILEPVPVFRQSSQRKS